MPGASDAAARSWSGFGSANGSAFIGKAEMTSDAAGQSKILEDFRQKYWQTPVLARRDRCDSGPRVAPREVLPQDAVPARIAERPHLAQQRRRRVPIRRGR